MLGADAAPASMANRFDSLPNSIIGFQEIVHAPRNGFSASGTSMRSSQECDDHHLAERFSSMAADLLAKAEEIEELRQPERLRSEDRKRAVA